MIDGTAFSIASGLTAVGLRVFVDVRWRRDIDASTLGLMFGGGFAIPLCVELIFAGWSGNPAELPPHWREYMAMSGVVGMAFSLRSLAKALRRPAEVVSQAQVEDE
jgi:hypothetical protein